MPDRFVAVYDPLKTIILSFRGAQNKQNMQLIKHFLKAILFPDMLFYKGIRVHEGFLVSYDTVKTSVRILLESLCKQYPNYTVSMTGHSLGGGIDDAPIRYDEPNLTFEKHSHRLPPWMPPNRKDISLKLKMLQKSDCTQWEHQG